MISRNGSRVLGGCFAAVALAAFVACGGAGSGGVASKYVKTVSVGAEGATITIASSDDATIAGTSITIPAHALSANTSISIGVSALKVAPAGSTAIGPVVDFEPSGTKFAIPVTMTLPVTLPGGTSASNIFVEAVEADGTARQIAAQYANGIATFHVNGFTSFGGATMSTDGGSTCATDSDCPTGDDCVSGVCSPAASSCTTDSDCPTREVCVSGSCAVPSDSCSTDTDCASGEVCISGSCSTASDGGAACGDGACDGGSSDAGCAAGQTDCAGTCVDTNTDPDNCGECRKTCPTAETCSGGVCS
jgi:Cys-rich repeat protein